VYLTDFFIYTKASVFTFVLIVSIGISEAWH